MKKVGFEPRMKKDKEKELRRVEMIMMYMSEMRRM